MRYNPALDGIRAIAVLMVLEYHGDWHTLGWRGYLGVDVFFVLSGFLITSILLGEVASGGIRLWEFYLRRARRLYPALCVLVATLLALGTISSGGAMNILLYLSDYLPPPGAAAHAWSLAVEEHYYLLWPLILPALARMKRQHAIWLLIAAYIVASVWSVVTPWEWRQHFRFDARMSGLVFGSLLAFLPRTSLLPVALAIGSYIAITLGFDANRAFTEAITAGLILLSYQTTLPFLTRAPLVYLGKISYGIYLFHWTVQDLLDPYFDGWQHLLVTIAGSVACASLTYHTVEAWFRSGRTSAREPAEVVTVRSA